MNDDFSDFFAADSTTEEEHTEAQTETEQVEEQVEETTEDETEAHAEVEPEVSAETETEVEVKPAPEPEERSTQVPLAALIEEREKAKQKQTEIDQLNQRIAEFEKAKQSSSMPDPYDEPQAYHEYMAREVDARVQQQMADYRIYESTERARREHGDEVIAELEAWAAEAVAKDPSIGVQAMQAPDPVQFVMDLKKRHESYAALEADEETFIRERALALGLIPTAQPAAVEINQSPKKTTAPKSIATASARGSNKEGFEDFFDAIDKK